MLPLLFLTKVLLHKVNADTHRPIPNCLLNCILNVILYSLYPFIHTNVIFYSKMI